MTKTLSSVSSIKKASLLNRVTYDLKLSSSRCLTFSKLAKDLLYLYLPIKLAIKCPLNSLKVETVLKAILLNHTLASPLSMVRNALHMILYTWGFWTTPDSRVGPLISRTPPLVASRTWPEGGRRWPTLWRVSWSDGLVRPGWGTLALSWRSSSYSSFLSSFACLVPYTACCLLVQMDG